MNFSFFLRAGVLSVTAMMSVPSMADLTLSGAPNGASAAEQDKAYVSVAKILSKELGETVTYLPPKDFRAYGDAMRKESYDIAIDGVQFASWRLAKIKHRLVAVTEHKNKVLVLVPAEDEKTHSPEDLVAHSVCMQQPPNMVSLMFLAFYNNPMQEPVPRYVKGFQPAIDALLSGQCKAAITLTSVYSNSIPEETRKKLRIAFETSSVPAITITVSKKLTDEQLRKLTNLVTTRSAENNPSIDAINLAGVPGMPPEKVNWVKASPDVVNGYDKILIERTFGWE
jgi:ABC-type phosphate/phosphonate transport system substrate-binding protein